MPALHRCHMGTCGAAATERCFDCGAWCCDEHRSTIEIPTFVGPFREDLCEDCLRSHLESPDPYGPISITAPVSGTSGWTSESA